MRTDLSKFKLNMTYILVPSKVHNMRVRAVGAESLYVTWEPPRQPNGYVRGYFITFESNT